MPTLALFCLLLTLALVCCYCMRAKFFAAYMLAPAEKLPVVEPLSLQLALGQHRQGQKLVLQEPTYRLNPLLVSIGASMVSLIRADFFTNTGR